MNSLSTFITILVLCAVALANVAALPNQGPYYGNSVGSRNCARSEVWSTCEGNPMCQKTCDNYKYPIACTRSGLSANMCYPGCVCREGFVRVVQGDQCIPIDKCEGRVKH